MCECDNLSSRIRSTCKYKSLKSSNAAGAAFDTSKQDRIALRLQHESG